VYIKLGKCLFSCIENPFILPFHDRSIVSRSKSLLVPRRSSPTLLTSSQNVPNTPPPRNPRGSPRNSGIRRYQQQRHANLLHRSRRLRLFPRLARTHKTLLLTALLPLHSRRSLLFTLHSCGLHLRQRRRRARRSAF